MTMRWLMVCFVTALGACACGPTGPNPYCVQQCEQRNDACMMSAGSAYEIQQCDQGMGTCLAYCR